MRICANYTYKLRQRYRLEANSISFPTPHCSPSRAAKYACEVSLKSVVNFTTLFAFLQPMSVAVVLCGGSRPARSKSPARCLGNRPQTAAACSRGFTSLSPARPPSLWPPTQVFTTLRSSLSVHLQMTTTHAGNASANAERLLPVAYSEEQEGGAARCTTLADLKCGRLRVHARVRAMFASAKAWQQTRRLCAACPCVAGFEYRSTRR